MSVDLETVQKVAHLARIRIANDEAERMVTEFNGLLEFISQLEEVDIQETEPLVSVVQMHLKKRPDRITDGGCVEDILANAPEAEDQFFLVPKVVE